MIFNLRFHLYLHHKMIPKITNLLEILRRRIYSQYTSRYVNNINEVPITNNTDNNLFEFLKILIGERINGNSPLSTYQDIINKAFLIQQNFNINSATSLELDNLGCILDQARPEIDTADYFEWRFTEPPDFTYPGTSWEYTDPPDGYDIDSLPFEYEGIVPEKVGVPDSVYRRVLKTVIMKLLGDDIKNSDSTYFGGTATINLMIKTFAFLINVPVGEISYSKNALNPLMVGLRVQTIGYVANNLTKGLVNWVNPNGDRIWSKMGGLTVATSQFN